MAEGVDAGQSTLFWVENSLAKHKHPRIIDAAKQPSRMFDPSGPTPRLRTSEVERFILTIMFILGRLAQTVGGRVSCRWLEMSFRYWHDWMHGNWLLVNRKGLAWSEPVDEHVRRVSQTTNAREGEEGRRR